MRIMTALLTITLAVSALAQMPAERLNFGNVSLQLGMPQDDVLAALGEHYDVRKINSSWWIQSKGAPPVTTFGYVTFSAGRLSMAGKSWSPADQEKGVELARAVYGALSALAQTSRPCLVYEANQQEPTASVESVVVACGSKKVQISILRKEGTAEAAVVTEVLGLQP